MIAYYETDRGTRCNDWITIHSTAANVTTDSDYVFTFRASREEPPRTSWGTQIAQFKKASALETRRIRQDLWDEERERADLRSRIRGRRPGTRRPPCRVRMREVRPVRSRPGRRRSRPSGTS